MKTEDFHSLIGNADNQMKSVSNNTVDEKDSVVDKNESIAIGKDESKTAFQSIKRRLTNNNFTLFLTIAIGIISVFSAVSIWQSSVYSSGNLYYQYKSTQAQSLAQSSRSSYEMERQLFKMYDLEVQRLILDWKNSPSAATAENIDHMIVNLLKNNSLHESDKLILATINKTSLIGLNSKIINEDETVNSYFENSPDPDSAYNDSYMYNLLDESNEYTDIADDHQTSSFMFDDNSTRWSFSATVCTSVLFLLGMAATLRQKRIRVVLAGMGSIIFIGVFIYILATTSFSMSILYM